MDSVIEIVTTVGIVFVSIGLYEFASHGYDAVREWYDRRRGDAPGGDP